MSDRNYGQFCAVAQALDILGERWTLLIIRDLLTGPKRFRDFQRSLRGMGTNLLSSRLKSLEAHGLLQRITLPPPASVDAYDLTSRGRDLEPVIIAMARWGLKSLQEPENGERYEPEWAAFSLRVLFRPEAAVTDLAVEINVEGQVIYAIVVDRAAQTGIGPCPIEPDLRMYFDDGTFQKVAVGTLQLAEAIAGGLARMEGDPRCLIKFSEMFPLVVPAGNPSATAQAWPTVVKT